ncbi:MAG TPA: GPR1/FUN34/YaaH family transporter [Dermatophilaceae bacterium]
MSAHPVTITEVEPAQSDPRDAAPSDVIGAPSAAFFAGNPAALGIPVFVAGAVALGLVLIGYVPAGAVGASIPIIFAATGLGLTISTLWSAAVGQTAVASIFGIFAGFWLSYAALVLGLTHNWFAISAAAAVHTQALFLITWLVILLMLTIATLRLPLAFTVLFVLVDACLAVVLAATLNGSSNLSKVGGVLAFAFAAVGVYLYLGIAAQATGGQGVPLGRPVVNS